LLSVLLPKVKKERRYRERDTSLSGSIIEQDTTTYDKYHQYTVGLFEVDKLSILSKINDMLHETYFPLFLLDC